MSPPKRVAFRHPRYGDLCPAVQLRPWVGSDPAGLTPCTRPCASRRSPVAAALLMRRRNGRSGPPGPRAISPSFQAPVACTWGDGWRHPCPVAANDAIILTPPRRGGHDVGTRHISPSWTRVSGGLTARCRGGGLKNRFSSVSEPCSKCRSLPRSRQLSQTRACTQLQAHPLQDTTTSLPCGDFCLQSERLLPCWRALRQAHSSPGAAPSNCSMRGTMSNAPA